MSKLLRKRKKKIGAPPGMLVYTGEPSNLEVKYHLIDYNAQEVIDRPNATLEECLELIEQPTVTWINVTGLHDPGVIEKIGHQFKLNPLVMEDILNPTQRPKCDDYKDYLYIVVRLFKKENGKMEDEQISIILGRGYLISFLEKSDDLFQPIRDRIKKDGSRMRDYGADYLAYALLDYVVDKTYSVVERIDDELEIYEEELTNRPSPVLLHGLQVSRRELAILKKNVWPLREVVSTMERRDMHLITDHTRFFLHDVHDHTIQLVETLEGFREVLAGMLDIYMSSISLKLNETMKFLTIVSTIFVPLTFVASVYGMNFDYMPGLHDPEGFIALIGIMFVLAAGMFYFFHRMKWL